MKAVTYLEVDVPEFVGGDDQIAAVKVNPITLTYDFTGNNNLSWVGAAATLTPSVDGSTLAATGTDPILRSPAALTINGGVLRYIRIDVERMVARVGGSWQGNCFYVTGGHAETAGFFKSFADLGNTVGNRAVYYLDMWALTAGGTDWQLSTITQLRFDFDDGVASGSVRVRNVTLMAEGPPGGSMLWDFSANNNLLWEGNSASLTASNDGVTIAATGTDPNFRSTPGLFIDGSVSRYVRLDIERTVARAGGTWEGKLYYTTAAHGESGSFYKAIVDITNTPGTRAVYVLDMWALDAGGTDWQTSIITRLRFDFDDGVASGSVKVRSITIGAANQDRSAAFNGSTYLSRTPDLTGIADAKTFTFSAWVFPTGTGTRYLWNDGAAGGGNRAVIVTGDFVEFTGVNAAGTQIMRQTTLTPLRLYAWNHVIVSMDLTDPAKCFVYINGVQTLLTSTTYTNDTMDFASGAFYVGATAAGASKFSGSLADFWWDPTYLDISNPANLGKFVSSRAGTVKLGNRGQTPLGTPPVVFLSGNYISWQLNRGNGVGFAVAAGSLMPSSNITETWRWAIPTDYLNPFIDAVPSMKSLSFTPATVSLGEDLGQRASITATFEDHYHSFNGETWTAGTFWGKWRGKYGTKLRNAPMRVIRGLSDQTLAQMDIRHYLMDTTDGPTPEGVYTMTAKDSLKLTDDARSQAPVVSNGSLAGSINNAVTSASLTPTGIGNLEYPASGFVCFGGKEVCSFTRVADVLTIARGQLNTTPIAHNAGDRVQLVLRYSGNDIADIIYDLLVTYTEGITPNMIRLADWQAETAAYLGVIYAAAITEPTSVKKLLIEIIDQASLALFWDDRAKLIRLKVLREIATTTDTFDEERIVTGSLKVSEQPEKRISQIWTFYGQRDPTDQADNEDNYRAALANVDLTLEAAYGAPSITKIPARWVATLTAAQRLNGIKLSRFRDPPRAFSFQLFRDQLVNLAEGYQVKWWANQNSSGVIQPAKIQVTKVRVENDYVYVEAEEMLASGVIVVTNTVFLLTTGGVLSFTVPATWNNSNNSIETLGGGGGGDGVQNNGGSGAGGGAYSSKTNQTLTPGGSVSYRVGSAGVGSVGSAGTSTDGGDTWFNGANLAASMVGSKGGNRANGGIGTGGDAAAGVGTIKTSGGNGGAGAPKGESRAGGGGGGGAGGPNGNGANGGTSSGTGADGGAGGGAADGGAPGGNNFSSGGANGGNNRFGFGGGSVGSPAGQQGGGGYGGAVGEPGGYGGEGQQIWTQTVAPILAAGPAGGAGGSGDGGGSAGSALNYGGGGAGAGRLANGGNGSQGIIVLTWR